MNRDVRFATVRPSRSNYPSSRATYEVRAAAASLAAIAVLAAGVAALAAPEPLAERSVSYLIQTMGTYANVVLVTADSAASAPVARSAHLALMRVDSLMTNWTATSEVARLNREAYGGPTVVQPEVATVLEAALATWREGDHAFDITVEPLVRLWGFLGGKKRVPSPQEIAVTLADVGAQHVHFDRAQRTVRFDDPRTRIDLGGIAKGYAVDVAAESLAAHGVKNGLVDLTGNMFAIGGAAGSDHWRIGIRDPRGRMSYFARLSLVNEAISTSGQYEQFIAANGKTYGHILNPRTGYPAEGLISVTVVAARALTTDAWDTPLFVLGPEAARRKAKERDDIAAILVAPGDGVDTVWVEQPLAARFVLEPAAREWFRVRFF
jgi:thiamine biosynthesis lipoprotein